MTISEALGLLFIQEIDLDLTVDLLLDGLPTICFRCTVFWRRVHPPTAVSGSLNGNLRNVQGKFPTSIMYQAYCQMLFSCLGFWYLCWTIHVCWNMSHTAAPERAKFFFSSTCLYRLVSSGEIETGAVCRWKAGT